jgi:hypothetical protein
MARTRTQMRVSDGILPVIVRNIRQQNASETDAEENGTARREMIKTKPSTMSLYDWPVNPKDWRLGLEHASLSVQHSALSPKHSSSSPED